MCVNKLSKVAPDSAAAGIEPAISSRKSNALTTTPPLISHTGTRALNHPETERQKTFTCLGLMPFARRRRTGPPIKSCQKNQQ